VIVLYDSFCFTPTERRYPTFEKELCAMVRFLVKWHRYLGGVQTTIIRTDHHHSRRPPSAPAFPRQRRPEGTWSGYMRDGRRSWSVPTLSGSTYRGAVTEEPTP
jgi:hypothetical protein